MGGFRALTRHNNNDTSKRFQNRKRTHAQATQDQEKKAEKQQKDLKLIELTADQEGTKDVKFVFDKLPTSKVEVNALLIDELKSPEHVLIGL